MYDFFQLWFPIRVVSLNIHYVLFLTPEYHVPSIHKLSTRQIDIFEQIEEGVANDRFIDSRRTLMDHLKAT